MRRILETIEFDLDNGCIHCLVLELIAKIAAQPGQSAIDVLCSVFQAACEMSVTYAKEGIDPEHHAKATGNMIAAMVLEAHKFLDERTGAADQRPATTNR